MLGVFFLRSGYAGTSAAETPWYHQRHVVAYPQNPEAALTAWGMAPENLNKMQMVQFVGEGREGLRHDPDLRVSVRQLRHAFT